MLNPRSYLEDCIRFGLPSLWATGFPWQAVNTAIDTDFNYNVPEEAKMTFMQSTGHQWKNGEDSQNKTLRCPRCSETLEIPWTTCGKSEKPTHQE